jgi:hypothetical protein
MVDAKAQLAGHIAAYNKSAKRRGFPIYADPVPVGKLSDLLDAAKPKYMTPEECAKFREQYFERRMHFWRAIYSDIESLAKEGFDLHKRQATIAQKPRGITDEIVGRLSTSPTYSEESAEELWFRFIDALQVLEHDPEEIPHASGDTKKSKCTYWIKDTEKHISFGRFANVVAEYRSGKKSR